MATSGDIKCRKLIWDEFRAGKNKEQAIRALKTKINSDFVIAPMINFELLKSQYFIIALS
jgi:hypothetical protein